MRRIRKSETEIVLRDTPVFYWIFGVIGSAMFGSGLIGLLVYAVRDPARAFDSLDGSWAGQIMAVVMFVIFAAFLAAATAAFVGFVLSPVITTRVDRTARLVEINRRSLIGKKVKRYELSQIKHFGIDSRPIRNGQIHFACLVLKNHKRIEVESKGSDMEKARETVDMLNDFLGSEKGN